MLFGQNDSMPYWRSQ